MSSSEDRDTAITRDPGYGQSQTPFQQQHAQPQHYQQQPQQYPPQYGPPAYYGHGLPYGSGFGRRRAMSMSGMSGWSETKPFFMTSEFLGTLLCILGVCIAAASTRDLNAHGAALFSTVLVAAYTVSRGIAKAGTRSRASDPRDDVHFGSDDNDR